MYMGGYIWVMYGLHGWMWAYGMRIMGYIRPWGSIPKADNEMEEKMRMKWKLGEYGDLEIIGRVGLEMH